MPTIHPPPHLRLVAALCMVSLVAACGASEHHDAPAPPPPPPPPPPPTRFLYVANMESHKIAGFRIDSSGALTSIGDQVAASADIRVLAVTPNAAFLYGGNQDTGLVDAYAVDPKTGKLTPLSGENPSPYHTPNQIINLAVDPAGKALYTCNMDGTVTAFAIGADGKLTLLENQTSTLYGVGTVVRVHPSGKWLYLATQGPNAVVRWTIGADGSLGEAVAVAVGGNNYGLAISPDGAFLYLTGGATSSAWGFRIDGATGELTATTPASFDLGGSSNGAMAIDPAGKHLYIHSSGDMKVHGFTIGADGALTPTATPTWSFGAGRVSAMAIDRGGQLLFATSGNTGDITGAAVDRTTGNLTFMPAPFPSGGTYPVGLALVEPR